MKQILIQSVLILAVYCTHGQGTLQFDQQVNPTTPPGGFFNIQPDPTGESFIPTLSSIGFVQFYFTDPGNNGLGSTISVNLWSDSIGTGTLLGTTTAVSMPDLFTGQSTFFFATPVSLNSGTTYYLQPVIQSGDSFEVGVGFQTYANGISYFHGTPDSSADLWFREGIVVPEPSSFSLMLLGLLGIYPVLRTRNKSKAINGIPPHPLEETMLRKPSTGSQPPHLQMFSTKRNRFAFIQFIESQDFTVSSPSSYPLQSL